MRVRSEQGRKFLADDLEIPVLELGGEQMRRINSGARLEIDRGGLISIVG